MNDYCERVVELTRRQFEREEMALEMLKTSPNSGFTASLLAEAIRDARAVRTIAYLNALKALEAAFEEPNVW